MIVVRFAISGFLAAAILLSGLVDAQTPSAPKAQTAKRFVPMVDLSPSGQLLAYTRLENEKLVLAVSNIAGEPQETAVLPLETKAVVHLNWLTDDQLLYSERQKDDLQVWHNTGDSILLLALEPEFTVASANLAKRTTLLVPKDRRELPRASNFVFGPQTEPGKILLSGWGGRGPVRALYSVSLTDGSYEALDFANRQTLGWSVDGIGQPALRVDENKSGTELHIFAAVRSAKSGTQWRQIGRYPMKAGSDPTPDFVPLVSGPAENQVYVLTRKQPGARRGLHVFDVVRASLVSEVFEHGSHDVREAILDESRRTVVAVILDDDRDNIIFLDPDKQKHLKAFEQFAGGDAKLTLEDVNSDETVWLLTVQSPTLGRALVRYDVRTSHARVLLKYSDLAR